MSTTSFYQKVPTCFIFIIWISGFCCILYITRIFACKSRTRYCWLHQELFTRWCAQYIFSRIIATFSKIFIPSKTNSDQFPKATQMGTQTTPPTTQQPKPDSQLHLQSGDINVWSLTACCSYRRGCLSPTVNDAPKALLQSGFPTNFSLEMKHKEYGSIQCPPLLKFCFKMLPQDFIPFVAKVKRRQF